MKIEHTRFGAVEYEPAHIIRMANGLIGFRDETEFVLFEPPAGRLVAWLQSIKTPALAFPVVAAVVFGPNYPTPGLPQLARRAQLVTGDDAELTALVVVASAGKGERIANLLAPIVVNVGARVAAQVVLDADVYSPKTPFDLTRVTVGDSAVYQVATG
jgi:flagellar assembly factor FliW